MASQFKQKWAVLIGPTEYEYVRKLKFCTKDVISVEAALKEYLGFKNENVLTFGTDLEHKPTLEEIYHQLGALQDSHRIGADDLLLFYFSGHGFKDKKDYLLPVSATPKALKKTAIDVEDLVTELMETKCKNVVMFIDACREEIPGAKGTASVGSQSKETLEREGIVTFFSCDPTDLSYEIDELEHGSFTHCFLDAIQSGKCETAQELYDYLLEELPPTNARYKKPPQKPYAVIQGAEKWNLPILEGNTKVATSNRQWDQILGGLGDLYAKRLVEDKYYEAAVELVGAMRAKRAEGENARKLELIERLSTGKMRVLPFTVAWDGIERLRIQGGGGPSIKSGLEPLQ